MTTASGNRRPRTIRTTDTEWNAIKDHADKAGMKIAEYIIEHARPARHEPDLAGAIDRIERNLAVLYEVERERLESNDRKGTWDACVASAKRAFDRERGHRE